MDELVLDDYLTRIGLTSIPTPDPEGLAMMQRAHRQTIGFENLDVMLGRGIRIDPPSLRAKLIEGPRRGGYCFEHNTLFGAMLAKIALENRPLLGRVWLGMEWPGDALTMPPLTHTLRLVTIAGAPWIADAGFGGSYVPPMPLVDGAEASTPDGADHRLRHIGGSGEATGEWLLERAGPASATDGRAQGHGAFQAQYSFGLGKVAPVDLELSNHWTSTRPGTRFTTACLASIVLADGFASLNGPRLSIHAGGISDVRDIADTRAWREVLADVFRVELTLDEVEMLGVFQRDQEDN
ncbi:MAG: arylamine N-acetyltransferase [Sphingomonadales bacterium]|nr:arylamine N-acetyltransferase [Sphingomonadales bacterium]MDE2169523.1 arylamine N-acetyltransferase [Sphingomonadales bacterium]